MKKKDHEIAYTLAKITGRKICTFCDGVLRNAGWNGVVRTGLAIDMDMVINPPTEDGIYELSAYTCDGSCSIGSKGHKKDGGFCSVYLEAECGKYCCTAVTPETKFSLTFEQIAKLIA